MNCHDANILFTGGTKDCHFDILLSHQWWQSWHHDDCWFSVNCLIELRLQEKIHEWYGYIHYSDVIMTTTASQITSLTVVYSNVYSDADQRKHQSSASLPFVWGIHRDRWIPRTKGQLRGKCFQTKPDKTFHSTSMYWKFDARCYLQVHLVDKVCFIWFDVPCYLALCKTTVSPVC